MSELTDAAEHVRELSRRGDDTSSVAALLYANWYARARGETVVPDDFPFDLVEVLRAADATALEWQEGWTAVKVAGNGRVIGKRSSEVRMADRCDYVATGRIGLLPRPGDELRLAARRDRVDADGSWWRTASATWQFTRVRPNLTRLYWSVEFGHLPLLVSRLTTALAGERRPWMLKCAADPAMHARADATVLYLAAELVDDVSSVIDDIASSLAPHARDAAPPLTLRVRPGLAASVDPGGDESFGEHRCRLIVEALSDPPALDGAAVARISERFAADGIDIERPFARRADRRLPWEP